MKKIFAIISVVVLALTGCNKDFLDTTSTQSVSGDVIFTDSETAMTAVNGMFRLMYTGDWGTSDRWASEEGGLPAFLLALDLMGEDHLMDGVGSGWFWEDYEYGTFGDYTGGLGRQYNAWNFYYTLVSNANYIIAQELPGDEDYKNYVLGQAYGVRAFAYLMLIQSFQQNGGAAGSEYRSLPGVPIYTEPTIAGSVGKGRGTVEDVYTQINNDLDKAIEHLSASALDQQHKSHIGLGVAYGLQARAALVEQDFDTALAAAKKAIEYGEIPDKWDEIKTINNVDKGNVMWGLKIQTDQAIGVWDIYAHMDADSKSTYCRARHLICNWLYDQIPDTDMRKGWWTAPLPESEWGDVEQGTGSIRSWCQKKLVYINASQSTGDHILMRVEEMYLIAAEAACEKGDFAAARDYLSALGSKRDSNYAARLAMKSNSKELNSNTVGSLITLMDEIYFQRRVELWGECPRILDIQRRGLAFDRDYEGSNHTQMCSEMTGKPRSANFIYRIPRAEFDGNENMNEATDQNPSQGADK